MPIDASKGPAAVGGGARTAPSEPQVVYAGRQTEAATAELRSVRAALSAVTEATKANTQAQAAIAPALESLITAVNALVTLLTDMAARIEANNGAIDRMAAKLDKLPHVP